MPAPRGCSAQRASLQDSMVSFTEVLMTARQRVPSVAPACDMVSLLGCAIAPNALCGFLWTRFSRPLPARTLPEIGLRRTSQCWGEFPATGKTFLADWHASVPLAG